MSTSLAAGVQQGSFVTSVFVPDEANDINTTTIAGEDDMIVDNPNPSSFSSLVETRNDTGAVEESAVVIAVNDDNGTSNHYYEQQDDKVQGSQSKPENGNHSEGNFYASWNAMQNSILDNPLRWFLIGLIVFLLMAVIPITIGLVRNDDSNSALSITYSPAATDPPIPAPTVLVQPIVGTLGPSFSATDPPTTVPVPVVTSNPIFFRPVDPTPVVDSPTTLPSTSGQPVIPSQPVSVSPTPNASTPVAPQGPIQPSSTTPVQVPTELPVLPTAPAPPTITPTIPAPIVPAPQTTTPTTPNPVPVNPFFSPVNPGPPPFSSPVGPPPPTPNTPTTPNPAAPAPQATTPPAQTEPTTAPSATKCLVDPAELKLALDKAAEDTKRRHVIEVCPGTIVLENSHGSVDGDPYFYKLEDGIYEFICTSDDGSVDPKERSCILDAGSDTDNGHFILNNATFNATGFTLQNGGGPNHKKGGAIHATNSSTVHTDEVLFSNNNAQEGSAMYLDDGIPNRRRSLSFLDGRLRETMNNLNNTEFVGNKAKRGGAIAAFGTFIRGNKLNFTRNEGSGNGGALFLSRGTLAIFNDAQLIDNFAGSVGGAVFATDGANVTFQNSVLSRNVARLLSSAIDAVGQSTVQILFSNITNNLVDGNDTRRTLFELDAKDDESSNVERLKNAAAIRSSGGIILENTTFSDNKKAVKAQPKAIKYEVLLNETRYEPFEAVYVFLDQNATPTNYTNATLPNYINVVYCEICRNCSGNECSNTCGQDTGRETPGKGNCDFSANKCFESGDELRVAVDEYFGEDGIPEYIKQKYGDSIGTWCVNKVIDFSYLFNGVDFGITDSYNRSARFNPRLQNFNEDLSGWNTSSALNMMYMFSGTAFNQDISTWDVSKVRSIEGMFAGNSAFNQNLSNWNTSSVTRMESLFNGAVQFNQDISRWDVSKVQSMRYMFSQAKFFNQNLTNWNVGSVTSMTRMFDQCDEFNGDLSLWKTSNVLSMRWMFYRAYSFNQDISLWDVSSVTSMNGMFAGFIYGDYEPFFFMSFNQNISEWNVSSVSVFSNMFTYTEFFNQDIGKWNVSSGTDFRGMFYNARSFNQDLSQWNVENADNMQAMFAYSPFNENLSLWNTSNVKDMSFMFYEADSFNQEISLWKTSNVINMSYMFYDADSFNQNISLWDVSSVEKFSSMFAKTDNFNQDIGEWDVRAGVKFNSMFYEAQSFNQSLCDWGRPFWVTLNDNTTLMFYGSACITTEDPVVDGSYCHPCRRF